MSQKEDFYSRCIVLDTETTGKDFNSAEVIESGFVIREDNDWSIFQEFHKPTIPIPPAVQALCYIVDDMVSDKLSFIATNETFQSVMDGYTDGYAVGHNYYYDMRVLQNHGITLPPRSICTWKLSKKLFHGVKTIEETNLPYLRFALNLKVPLDLRCHRAGVDSYITARLLEYIVGQLEKDNIIDINKPYGPQIIRWIEQPIILDTWPIGKYKGWKFKDIPISYWAWAAENIDSLNSDSDKYDHDLYTSLMAFLDNN